MGASGRARISFGQAIAAAVGMGLIALASEWMGAPEQRTERGIDSAPRDGERHGRLASSSGPLPPPPTLQQAINADHSPRTGSSSAIGGTPRHLPSFGSDPMDSLGSSPRIAHAGRLHGHRSRDRTGADVRGSHERVDAAQGSGAIAMGPKLDRAQQAANRSDRPADPAGSPAEKSAKDPSPTPPNTSDTRQAVTAPEPVGGPVDDVIPVKAGDMEAADNHSKVRRNGDVFMFANSTLTTGVDLPAASDSLSIFAHGDKAFGEWPRLVVTINGQPVAEVVVNSAVEKKFWVPVHVDPGSAVIGVSFVNDRSDPATGQDRNAYVNKIKVHVGR